MADCVQPVGEISARNFGLIIAYLIPGFVVVLTVGGHSSAVATWLATAPDGQPTVGGFLYVTLASLAAGMIVSAIRWVLIDTLNHHTGVKQPRWDFSSLEANHAAYTLLVDFHYRYYQFNANTLVALLVAYSVRLAGRCTWCGGWGWTDAAFLCLETVLFVASRDALRKYFSRVSQILGSAASRRNGVENERRQESQTGEDQVGKKRIKGQGGDAGN